MERMFLLANVLPRPVEPVEGAVGVGEERVAADADEQPNRTGLHGLRRGAEVDRRARDEHVTGRFGLPRLVADGVVSRADLRAVPELGEREGKRDIGVGVAVVVDVDPVDAVGVEFRFHQERRHSADAGRVRVRIHDQRRAAWVVGGRERREVGEVQACVVAGELEVGGAVMVGHGDSLVTGEIRVASGTDRSRP
jgi:hypothetical protein